MNYGYSPYPQVQNPYLQSNYSPYGQFQQNQYQVGNQIQSQPMQQLNEVISGSIVDSEDVVRSKNCSLDGTPTFYPLSDSTAIYVKKLNPQTGAGQMFKYKLDIPEQNNQPSVEQLLSSFKIEISNEIAELKNLVLETKQKDPNQFMNKPRNNGGEK